MGFWQEMGDKFLTVLGKTLGKGLRVLGPVFVTIVIFLIGCLAYTYWFSVVLGPSSHNLLLLSRTSYDSRSLANSQARLDSLLSQNSELKEQFLETSNTLREEMEMEMEMEKEKEKEKEIEMENKIEIKQWIEDEWNDVALKGLHIVWEIYFVGMIYWNYFYAVWVGPKYPDSSSSNKEKTEDRFPKSARAEQNKHNAASFSDQYTTDHSSVLEFDSFSTYSPSPPSSVAKSRFCKSCKIYKPLRTHHCHICNRCVLKMDHHCPWIGNCVGFANHRAFVLFLLWITIGCGMSAFLSWPVFSFAIDTSIPWPVEVFYVSRMSVFFLFAACAALSFACGALCAFHFYLIFSGQTTIETLINSSHILQYQRLNLIYKNPYDLGYRNNFSSFFGFDPLLVHRWLLLPIFSPVPGDGFSYSIRPDLKLHSISV